MYYSFLYYYYYDFFFFLVYTTAIGPAEFCEYKIKNIPPPEPVILETKHSDTTDPQPSVDKHCGQTSEKRNIDLNKLPDEE